MILMTSCHDDLASGSVSEHRTSCQPSERTAVTFSLLSLSCCPVTITILCTLQLV